MLFSMYKKRADRVYVITSFYLNIQQRFERIKDNNKNIILGLTLIDQHVYRILYTRRPVLNRTTYYIFYFIVSTTIQYIYMYIQSLQKT